MSTLRATILIGVLSLLSKILGAVRQGVFANRFGAGPEADIYVAAFRVPDLLFNLLILGTLSVAFIPVFVQYLNRAGKHEAFVIASTIFNMTLVVMGGLSFLGAIFAPALVKVIVPGFSAEAQQQTAALTRVLMLSPLLFSLSSVFTSVLHSFKKFLLASIAPLFYNLAIIFGIVYLYPRYGLVGLSYGVVLGAGIHLLVQFPAALRTGFRPWRAWEPHHAGVVQIGRLFLPRVFGIELGQVSLLVASVMGSFLGAGSLAVFYFAYDLETVPLGVFAVSFAIAAFPTMTEYFSKKNIQGFKTFFAQTVVQILFLMVPISVFALLLRAQIVRLILGAGQNTNFSFVDTALTAQALGIFALSLFAQSLVPLLARSFYAMQNTRVPVFSGLAAAAVTIGLAAYLTPGLGTAGLAASFSVGITVHMVLMLVFLYRRLHGLEDDFIILRTLKIAIASVVMAVATFLTLYAVAPLVDMQTYFGIAVQTVSAFAAAILSYLAAGHAVALPEAKQVIEVLRSWFTKFTRPLTSTLIDMFTDLR